MIARIRRKRAQAAVETALILPLIIFLMLGSADLGRAFYLKLEMSGASRAGMRMAVLGQAVDIGNAVRAEPNSAIPNSYAAWGLTAQTNQGGTNGDCTSASQRCGDPGGCDRGSASAWTLASQQACFAVRTCLSWSNGVCSSFSSWGQRPNAGQEFPIQVRAVYRFSPATPLMAAFAGAGGSFYLVSDTIGLQLY